MTYIVSADWHCHGWSQFSTVEDGVNSRLQHVMDEVERMADQAERAGAKRVYVAGDIFHVRGSIKPTVFNVVSNTLSRLASERGIEFILMPGNHDLESVESEDISSAITSLGEIEGVRVYSKPVIIPEDRVALLPWENTREGLLAAVELLKRLINDMDERVCDYDLHLHTGINGVLIGVPDHGWSPEELAGFGFKRVFAGHYHDHAVFSIDGCKVVSIGSPAHQTWRDVGSRSGFIEVQDDIFHQIETNAPSFVDFDIERDTTEYAGNFVRVRGVEMDESDVRAMREGLHEAGALGVTIDPLAKPEVTRDTKPTETLTVEGQIKDYASEDEDYGAEVEKGALAVLKLAREVSVDE